nr:unnamed protein product [Callosobruchus chinensis]
MGFNLVNGGWSPWSPWTDCRCPGATLSAGKQSTRTCSNPPPSNGGKTCQGISVRKTKDCVPCPQAEPARWSSWSEWSDCNTDCTKIRKRQCIAGNGGKKACSGKDIQSTPCSAEQCRSMELTRVREERATKTPAVWLAQKKECLQKFIRCNKGDPT